MAGLDHFKILGVEETCSSEDVKKAYFKLAKLYHPDACKSDSSIDKFRLICSSYEVLKNDRSRADYLLVKNGHDWDKRGSQNKYNNVQSDFEKAQRAANKQNMKDMNSFMNRFERLIHPKNLFVIIPSGIFVYWMMTSYVPDFFKKGGYSFFGKEKIDDGSVSGNIKAKSYRAAETVDAWKNPKTNRWESPAPWDPNYRMYIATSPLEKVDRNLVFQTKSSGK